MSRKYENEPKTIIDTVVGPRAIAADAGQKWFEGEGRGYTREFIDAEDDMTCDDCGDTKAVTAFPTYSVPRKDGATRATTCRACRDEALAARRVAKAEAEAARRRSEKASKAAKARWNRVRAERS